MNLINLKKHHSYKIHLTPLTHSKKYPFKHELNTRSPLSHNSIGISPIFSTPQSRKPKISNSEIKSLKKLCYRTIDDLHKSKLNISMSTKTVFVLQDGSSVISGKKLPGFKYSIQFDQIASKQYHLNEMKEFYSYCKDYFKSTEEFKYLFSHSGKLLRCLHEINSGSKMIIVGHTNEFKGITEEISIERIRPFTRSPVYRNQQLHSDNSIILKNINSQFIYSTNKCNNSDTNIILPSIKHKTHRVKRHEIHPNLGSFEKLKVKLGDISSKIDKTFPPIHDQGLKQLKEKYSFTEGEFHKLYAKFKLLVLLSCGVNPLHKSSTGINRQSFIEYYSSSPELAFALGRIFDTFDLDGEGTIS